MKALVLLSLFVCLRAGASDTTRLYNPFANAERDVAALLQKAKAEGKHVLLQIGGNWCINCYRFNAVVKTDSSIKRLMDSSYLVYHLNHSKENTNEVYLKKLGNPHQYGFPALVVLDATGKVLHTQPGGLLAKGNGYDEQKIMAFLRRWSPNAEAPVNQTN